MFIEMGTPSGFKKTVNRVKDFLDRRFAHLALLPALFVLFLVIGYSLYHTVSVSFQDISLGRLSGDWVGFGNFSDIFTDYKFWRSFLNTFYFTGGTLILEILVALPVALVLGRLFRGVNIFRGIVLLPFIVAPVVAAGMWRWALDANIGIVNFLLLRLHLIDTTQAWLINEQLAMVFIICASVWIKFPIVSIILVGGLHSIPKELYDASKVDGATAWQCFRFVTLPLIRNFILLALILRIPFALRQFDLVWLITGGGPAGATEVLGTNLYKHAFLFFEGGSAAAMSVILLLLTFAVTVPYVKSMRRR